MRPCHLGRTPSVAQADARLNLYRSAGVHPRRESYHTVDCCRMHAHSQRIINDKLHTLLAARTRRLRGPAVLLRHTMPTMAGELMPQTMPDKRSGRFTLTASRQRGLTARAVRATRGFFYLFQALLPRRNARSTNFFNLRELNPSAGVAIFAHDISLRNSFCGIPFTRKGSSACHNIGATMWGKLRV